MLTIGWSGLCSNDLNHEATSKLMRQENPPSFHGVKMEKTYPEADQNVPGDYGIPTRSCINEPGNHQVSTWQASQLSIG